MIVSPWASSSVTGTTISPSSFASYMSSCLSKTTSNSVIQSGFLPKSSLLVLAAAASSSSSSMSNNNNRDPQDDAKNNTSSPFSSQDEIAKKQSTTTQSKMLRSFVSNPRAKSCVCMAAAMALHFGGYEFARSGSLALFTSSEFGFSHPAAHPLAIGLVTPVSLCLLYWYGLILKSSGPRQALKSTTLASVSALTVCGALLKILQQLSLPSMGDLSWPLLSKTLVAILFVFQNSYAHLLYTQHWSFLGSVMTPSEGTKWFSPIAGLSSIICTMAAAIVHHLVPYVGLLGLILGTSLTLFASGILADKAYALSEKNGFDPTADIKRKHQNKDNNDINKAAAAKASNASLLSKTAHLFRAVPTLAALFCEVISFQSLSTVLNVCFVRKLKEAMPLDQDRASFTGQFYAYVNGSAGVIQFFVLPLARKYLEPKWAYQLMPLLLVPFLVYATFQSIQEITSGLWITAAAFFALKTLDYSLRNVVQELVYQPLDFDSRYLGKEVIGVFANRFGKSGMSIILSILTAHFPGLGVPQLSQVSLGAAGLWTFCSFWLSWNVVTNQEAERCVKARQKTRKED